MWRDTSRALLPSLFVSIVINTGTTGRSSQRLNQCWSEGLRTPSPPSHTFVSLPPAHPHPPTSTPSPSHQHTLTLPPAHPHPPTSTPSPSHQHTHALPSAHPHPPTSTPSPSHQHTLTLPPAHHHPPTTHLRIHLILAQSQRSCCKGYPLHCLHSTACH